MSSQKVCFELSIVAVCSWLKANYEYCRSSCVSRDSIWRHFVSDHKQQGFSVNNHQCNEFLGYVGEYITKSALMQNVVMDKGNKRYVNLQQKRSSPPEEVSIYVYYIISSSPTTTAIYCSVWVKIYVYIHIVCIILQL